MLKHIGNACRKRNIPFQCILCQVRIIWDEQFAACHVALVERVVTSALSHTHAT